jgi:UDP-glucose 4-epimerase
VIHFAANPEVRLDSTDSITSFRENVVATHSVLEALVHSPAKAFVFASSSTVYGDAKVFPTPEDYAPLLPVSVYGATKLAGEALVAAYSKTYGLNAGILRLANIVGPRGRIGIVPDFIRKLKTNPGRLQILGDGTQRKSYLHVDDCVEAVLKVLPTLRGVEIYNVGSEGQTDVREIADIVCQGLKLHPHYEFTGGVDGGRGWVGDVKFMLLDTRKLRSLGWKPRRTSSEAVKKTIDAYVETESKLFQ